MLTKLKNWFFGPSLIVYVACRMSGRDKVEMVDRALYVVSVLKAKGINAISPVVEEQVEAVHGPLLNVSVKLKQYWKRDKDIIRYLSHAVILDQAEDTSFGMTREYSLNRGTLWRPTVIVLTKNVPVSVAIFEDDFIATSVHSAAAYMAKTWGSRYQRVIWRIRMLTRTLPKFFLGQLYGFR